MAKIDPRRSLQDTPKAFTPSSGTMRVARRMPSSSTFAVAPRVGGLEPFDAASPRCRRLVRVLCSPGSDSLDGTHAFLAGYAQSRFRQQVAQRLSVACYELLSNALNYGAIAEDVAIELMELTDVAAVRVTNDTTAARISMLNDHLAKLREDPEAAMIEEMRRSTTGGALRPMLGLARVVHEAGLQLDSFVQGRTVALTASCPK